MGQLKYWDGSAWQPASTGVVGPTGPTGAASTVTGPTGPTGAGTTNVPLSTGPVTTSYSLRTSDIGKYVRVSTSGSITIPNSVFSEGDIVTIINDTSTAFTITCSITTAYIGGLTTDYASVTLATRGMATVFFISGTVCYITGNVS